MDLLPDDLKSRLPPLYSQEAADDPIVYAKYSLPTTAWTWYVLEGEPLGEDFRFFGFVVGHSSEFGYFLLSELNTVKSPTGSGVERESSFLEGNLTDVVPAPEN